jgi:phosphopantothenoylcysteine decarboxylase / phosphopantothenate---cysteine ligase
MNPRMWAHAATQANVALLRQRGAELVGPHEGELAEGEWGVGRMAEPEEIFERIEALLAKAGSLAGKQVLVTAGGTREPLDQVRFVGNRSSGRMGVALAEEARRRGAEVTLVAANLAVVPPGGVTVVEAPTAADVAREVLGREADVLVMAAAVADYRPAESLSGKRPKDGQAWTLELEPTVDVLRELGSRAEARPAVVVGFAAEHGEGGVGRARAKLEAKGANLFVFNDVSREDVGFEALENEVVLVFPDGERRVEKAPKGKIASEVMDEIVRILEGNGRTGRR